MTKALAWRPGHVYKDGQLVALERKELPFHVKIIDAAEGIVECYVAGIGNIDDVKDRIHAGAFVESLAARNPKGVWSHDWAVPVGKTLESEEVPQGDPRLPEKVQAAGAGALRIKAQFNLNTSRGRDAFSDVEFYGDEQEWSIGFIVEEAKVDPKTGIREITKISLFEWSPVLFGANPITATASVKTAAGTPEEKLIPGSWEDEMVRLGDSLRDLEQSPCYAVATFDASVVYIKLELDDDGWVTGESTWRRTYTKDGDVYSFGEAEPVAIVETIQTRAARARMTEKQKPDEPPVINASDEQLAVEAVVRAAAILASEKGAAEALAMKPRLLDACAAIMKAANGETRLPETSDAAPEAADVKEADDEFQLTIMQFEQERAALL